ncbi:hypothetical protein D6774_04680 [Candidatus Woesearchaeota archaeon]|nr:MAG: hypothetical protein D6774_04680 [Candidatus Woesearchaeota archaeon]
MIRKRASQIAFAFLLLTGIVLVLHSSGQPSITGFAVKDSSQTGVLLESALNDNSVFSKAGVSNLCLIVENISYDVSKTSDVFVVSQSSGDCDGPLQEDLIIKFNSYEDFLGVVSDPTPLNIVRGRAGVHYYILPSRMVQTGGNVICDAEFKAKYCPVARSLTTEEELIRGDLTCCIDKLTPELEKLMEEHYASGTFVNEDSPVVHQPANNGFWMWIIGLFVGLLVIILISVITLRVMTKEQTKKSESNAESNGTIDQLKAYIEQTLAQGYSPEQIRAYLEGQGWSDAKLDEAFSAITKQESQSVYSPISIPEK